jgi:hypothetical protein
MSDGAYPDLRFMAVLMDCDLYESHKVALPFTWRKMTVGGYMFLDEYYSLKFPGARIATNEYFKDKKETPKIHKLKPLDFERWSVVKEA